MTEVDTIMHEGSSSSAPAPAAQSSRQSKTTAIAESTLKDRVENDDGNNAQLDSSMTDNNPKSKITESTSLTSSNKKSLSDNGNGDVADQSNADKSDEPMEVDDGDDDNEAAKTNAVEDVAVTETKTKTKTTTDGNKSQVTDDSGEVVTTTTNEQESEEDTQVTSSSSSAADGDKKVSKSQKTIVDQSEKETEADADADAEAECIKSRKTTPTTEISIIKVPNKTEEQHDGSAAESTKEQGNTIKANHADATVTVANVCDSSQSSESEHEITTKGQNNIPDGEDENSTSSEKRKKNADVDDDNDKDNDAGNCRKKINSTSDSVTQKLSSESTKDDAVTKRVEKEKDLSATSSPANVVERIEIDEEEDDDPDNDDPLRVSSEPRVANSSSVGKNGVSSDTEKDDETNKNGSVVDLGDSEDENAAEISPPKENSRVLRKRRSNGSSPPEAVTPNVLKKPHSVCSDSDGAVVIGSDSENEVIGPETAKPPSNDRKSYQLPPPPHESEEEDDDDDCVVIEDDSPIESTPSNDQAKRKSSIVGMEMYSDDSQPPNKRLRGAGVTQIAIKDARSLVSPDATVLTGNGKRTTMDGNVYPINITPASSSMTVPSGPPKLAPLGGGSGPLSIGTLPGLTGMMGNANLLPGLTDDMFVLEAPSFIVPYIYEKPPSDSLEDVVKGIESKYELTREDLTEADKSDDFDMMTEQNKEDKEQSGAEPAGGKKKKKRRFAAEADDSWSEESDDDDDDEDDDDSDPAVRTKVLIKEATDDLAALKGAIKPASAVTQSVVAGIANTVKPGQENYFESPLGKFFMNIGVGLVQEFVQSDLIRLQKRKMRKSIGKNLGDFERAITALSGNLEASKKKNSPFKFTMKRCEFCNFKSESALAMAHHYETPHMNGPLYKCNFCTFEIRNATEIVYHMEAMHNIKARLIKPLPYHQCPNCGFEDNGKAKLARHQPVCAKKFRPELNLGPPNDWEAPAKIPRIKPRHGLVGTATAYQAMAAQAAAQKAALATIQQQQQVQARNLQAAALAAQNAANKIRGRPPVLTKTTNIGPNGTASLLRGTNPTGPRPMATNVVLPNNYQLPGNQIIQTPNALNAPKKTTLPGQPSISITPLPRQNATTQAASTSSTSKAPPAGMKPGRSPAGNKAQFVICEICDGYIKDLEQLRNHMQWMHEVKIHPKMIYNRPPLNCQKCQFRFFTDQGLERHLLGSHGLVTSSMQEAANKGKDAGRCPVCGRMYQWKLLNHVARDHHMTLKPAHLSYKCTVCTATFGMYKQFETHVYTAHSTVAKKAMDSKKNSTAASGGGGNAAGSGNGGGNAAAAGSSNISQRSSISTAASNESLLKPLKINDEITIIPQPASKPRITNMESHVID